MRELDYRLNAINRRQVSDIKFEAKLHGHDIKVPTPQKKTESENEGDSIADLIVQKKIEAAVKEREIKYGK